MPGDAFGALYRAFLGRPNGPRAGWLLAIARAAFVVYRLSAAPRAARAHERRIAAAARGRRRRSATGAVAKGEDPQLVDRALALDEERRRAAR